MKNFKILMALLCLMLSVQMVQAQDYYFCRGCDSRGYIDSGRSLCPYCDGYCGVEKNSWAYKEFISKGYSLPCLAVSYNSAGEYERSKWNTKTQSYDHYWFKNGKMVRKGVDPSNSVNSYSGSYNSGSVGSSPIRQERDLEQEKRQQKDPHNHRCFKCNETGRYTCPCHSVPIFGNKRYHQCSNCNQNHEVGTGLNPHKCKCNDCGGDGIK